MSADIFLSYICNNDISDNWLATFITLTRNMGMKLAHSWKMALFFFVHTSNCQFTLLFKWKSVLFYEWRKKISRPFTIENKLLKLFSSLLHFLMCGPGNSRSPMQICFKLLILDGSCFLYLTFSWMITHCQMAKYKLENLPTGYKRGVCYYDLKTKLFYCFHFLQSVSRCLTKL